MIRRFMMLQLAVLITLVMFASRTSAEDQKAKDNLRRALAAVGGEGRLKTLQAPTMWMETGTFYGDGEAIPFIGQYASKWPDWYRQKIEGAFSIGVDGDTAFVETPAGVDALEGDQLKEQLTQVRIARMLWLFPLSGEDYDLSSIPGIEINGRPTIGIKASHKDGREADLYFDKDNYLLTKMETEVVTPQTGPDPVKSETFYSDHKSFGGATMPGKYKLVYDGELFAEAEIVAIKVHATVDPEWFSGPKE